MAYQITDLCIKCGVCADECPADAISEIDGEWVVDMHRCIDCGACVEVCPTDAIIVL